MKNALILAPFSDRHLQRLRRSVRVSYESWLDSALLYDPEELARRLRRERIHFLVVEGDFVFEETMEEAPELELIGICRNALNHVDVDAATDRGILVVNAPGRNAVAVAEMTVGLMLALAHRIADADAYVKAGRWDDPIGGYQAFRGTELAGKTAGIVGLGAIGRLVARRLLAMEMRLCAHDPFLEPERIQEIGATPVSLEDLLAQSDYVLVHATANEETMGMIAGPQLAAMKSTAYLVNSSAAGVVDEAALIEALEQGSIAGAALDVFEGHPLPESSRLRLFQNVILTPHIGGATDETVERQSAMIAEDVLLAVQGRRPVRLVNPEAWERRQSRRQRVTDGPA